MTTEPLAGCALALSADDLSAWRDGALDGATKAHLDTHIAECAACRARLAEYDAIARALRAIPTPEPASSFGRNPRFHDATAQPQLRRRSAVQRRRALGGLGAVAAVALLLLAFTQVFGRLGVQSPLASATRSPTTLATTAASATPASNEATLPAFRFASADSAWGKTGLVAHNATTWIDASTNFIPSALLPDGSALVGQIYHYMPSVSARLALWNTTSHKVTPLNVPGSPTPFSGIMTDGRYVVFQSASGCSCLSVYDLSVGGVIRRIPNAQGAGPVYFDHGLYVEQSPNGGVNSFTVATGTHATLPDANPASAHAQLLAFSWPYLVYMPDPTATTLPGALAVRDLATGQDANLAPLAPLLPDLLARLKDTQNPGVAVTDGALFVVTAPSPDVNQLYELDNFMSAAPMLKPIASVEGQSADPIILRGANARVVGMRAGAAPPVAYDRALGKAVMVSMVGLGAEVTGHFVVVMAAANAHEFDPYVVNIYDTNKLPGG